MTFPHDDGIVVVRGWKGAEVVASVPSVLSARLGPDASKGLVELLEAERHDWSDQVLILAGERFERRLVEEASKLRIEMSTLGSVLRQEIAKDRFALLRWMFLFWVSQLASMSAIMSFLLRK
ncbi:MAG TPA: hypothetical protein VEL79_01975 [Vicinamibacterales bacterium]|nr:hypothetical protein [Vicinamibacterales bacterium]